MPQTGSRGLDSARSLLSELKRGYFYGWSLRELGVGAILLLPVRNTGVKVAHASTDAFA